MPNPSAAKKTASARKFSRAYLLLALLAFGVLIVLTSKLWNRTEPVQLRAAGHTYTLEVAHTPAQQAKGLGGRASMPADRGMLFTYAVSGRYCYWMKGMQFPLDIIWLDADKRIVSIEPGVGPDTYPASYCPAGSNTRYVIELNAGQVKRAGLAAGQQLDF